MGSTSRGDLIVVNVRFDERDGLARMDNREIRGKCDLSLHRSNPPSTLFFRPRLVCHGDQSRSYSVLHPPSRERAPPPVYSTVELHPPSTQCPTVVLHPPSTQCSTPRRGENQHVSSFCLFPHFCRGSRVWPGSTPVRSRHPLGAVRSRHPHSPLGGD